MTTRVEVEMFADGDGRWYQFDSPQHRENTINDGGYEVAVFVIDRHLVEPATSPTKGADHDG